MNSEVQILKSSHGPASSLGEPRQWSPWPWELYQALGPRSWPYSQLQEKATSPRHIADSGTKSVGKKKKILFCLISLGEMTNTDQAHLGDP